MVAPDRRWPPPSPWIAARNTESPLRSTVGLNMTGDEPVPLAGVIAGVQIVHKIWVNRLTFTQARITDSGNRYQACLVSQEPQQAVLAMAWLAFEKVSPAPWRALSWWLAMKYLLIPFR